MNGTRLIDLPPRLACTVTVVYKPRPPLFWHTGSLSFRVLPTRKHGDAFHGPRNYSVSFDTSFIISWRMFHEANL